MTVSAGVLLLLMVGTFSQIAAIVNRNDAEAAKLDVAQEGREFMFRITRDLHSAGYPNVRMFETGVLSDPPENDSQNAVGLVYVSATELWFEGDVDGNGEVESIRYVLEADDEEGQGCPCSVYRSQVVKLSGTPPVEQSTNYFLQLGNVINSAGDENAWPLLIDEEGYEDMTMPPLFAAFDADGNELPLPLDLVNTPEQIESVRTIRITVNILSPRRDRDTGLRPVLSLVAASQISN